MCTDCSIREYRSDFSPLCWHNVPAYYALNYAGIFDGGLVCSCVHPPLRLLINIGVTHLTYVAALKTELRGFNKYY